MTKTLSLGFPLLLFTLFVSRATGQVATAELGGTVIDASGAAVPGAKAKGTLTNPETNVVVAR